MSLCMDAFSLRQGVNLDMHIVYATLPPIVFVIMFALGCLLVVVVLFVVVFVLVLVVLVWGLLVVLVLVLLVLVVLVGATLGARFARP